MSEQKYKMSDPGSDLVSGNGSTGVFICTSAAPFDYNALTDQNIGKMGFAVKFDTVDGSNASVTSFVANGVLGDTSVFTDLPLTGVMMEIEQMTVGIGTIAWIYLKETPEKVK